MGWQEAGGVCRQVVDMGLNAGLCEHDGPPLPTGLRYWLPSFSLRAAPHWSSLGGALAAPHVGLDAHTVVIVLETRRRNVGRLSVCEFKTRSGPVSPWAPVGGSGTTGRHFHIGRSVWGARWSCCGSGTYLWVS